MQRLSRANAQGSRARSDLTAARWIAKESVLDFFRNKSKATSLLGGIMDIRCPLEASQTDPPARPRITRVDSPLDTR